MRIRFVAPAALVVLGSVGFVMLSYGQDTRPALPPVTPPPRPIAPEPAPIRKPTHQIAKLKPLERQIYLSARRASAWLHRMHEQKGRFVHGWLPSLNGQLEGDNVLRQVGATFALARASRFFQDADQDARAKQAILSLLADTETSDGKTGKLRIPKMPSAVVNQLSVSSLLVLAINELVEPDKDLLTASEELCAFIRSQVQADGAFQVAAGEASNLEEYPGQALHALMRSHERKPATWKIEVVRKAMPTCMKWWREHKSRDFCAWHTAAYAEAFLATKEKAFAEAIFEMNDWVCSLLLDRLDPAHPQWLGGFRNVEKGKPVNDAPDITSAVCCTSLAEACRVTREMGDLVHHERYSASLERGLQFVMTLQYNEANTQHFADWYRNERLLGGFHVSSTNGDLRIDHTQHAVSALVEYLRWVVQVQ